MSSLNFPKCRLKYIYTKLAKLNPLEARDCFITAQDIAPKDTYNLVLYAMSLRQFGNDYAIYYSGAVAPYTDYLENGTKNFDGHKGFIRDKTYHAVERLIDSMRNNRFQSELFQTTRNRVNELNPNLRTNARYLEAIGGVQNVSR